MGLRQGARLYLDTNVVIRLLEKKDVVVMSLLAALREAKGEIVTSELTVAEALVLPLNENDDLAARVYEDFLTSGDGVRVLPIDRDILRRTAALRAEFRALKTLDAIHLASALAAECDVLISGDLRLRTPEGLPLVQPEDFLEWSSAS